MALRDGLHYNPGHYLLIYGREQTVESLARLIRGTPGSVNDIPNLLGVQKRYVWKQMQPVSFGPLNGPAMDDLFEDLATCKRYNIRLRMLLMIKALLGGKAVPDDLRTAANEGGVWNWPVGTTRNEHPKLYVTNVKNAMIDFVTKLCIAVDSFGKPADDVRHWLEDIAFNETSWGNGWWGPYGWTDAQAKAAQQQCGVAFKAAHQAMVANLKGHFVTHFINFPNNANFSILSDPIGGLPASMLTTPIAMGGPDSWMDDADAERGCFTYYPNFERVAPLCVSVQNANYQHYNHDDQTGTPSTGPIYRYDITIDQLYKHATQAGVMFRGRFRPGLQATHVVWSAMSAPIPGSDPQIVPFNNLRTYMRRLWSTPGTPEYHNISPGVHTYIPAMLEAGAGGGTTTPTVPTAVVPSLATDSGVITDDKITNVATINLAGLQAGAVKQWSISETGPWTDGDYVPTQGLNRVFFRQRAGSLPGPMSDPFEFTFVNVPPQMIRSSGSGQYIFLQFARAGLDLSNLWKADKTFFKLKRAGAPDVVPIGVYVSEPLKYCRLELNPNQAMLAGQAFTLDYTPTGTDNTKFLQDIAGNKVTAFTGLVINNTTGMAPPTKTCTITQVNNNTVSGGYSNNPVVTIRGVVSAPLEAWEEIEVRRNAGQVGFTEPAAGQVGFQIQDPLLQDTGLRNYSARVINGQLQGALSPQFAITFDTKFPSVPTVLVHNVVEGEPMVLTGLWSNGTNETLYVHVNGVTYTTASSTPIVLEPGNPKAWSLNLGVLPIGLYSVLVRTVDPAGNESATDGDDFFTVEAKPSVNSLILMLAGQRPSAEDYLAAAAGEEE